MKQLFIIIYGLLFFTGCSTTPPLINTNEFRYVDPHTRSIFLKQNASVCIAKYGSKEVNRFSPNENNTFAPRPIESVDALLRDPKQKDRLTHYYNDLETYMRSTFADDFTFDEKCQKSDYLFVLHLSTYELVPDDYIDATLKLKIIDKKSDRIVADYKLQSFLSQCDRDLNIVLYRFLDDNLMNDFLHTYVTRVKLFGDTK